MSVLEPFVPAFARRWIAEASWSSDQPTLRRGRGVVLAADLVGFTALTDRFARESAEGGAEAVQGALNSCFGTLVSVIGRYEGEVLAFAGDATMAVWWCEEDELGDTVARAAACGIAIQEILDGVEAAPGFPVRLRVAISAGSIWGAVVGGDAGHWHALMGGEPFLGVADAEEAANPGDIVLDAAALKEVAGRVRFEFLDGGAARLVEVVDAPRATEVGASVHSRDPGIDLRKFVAAAVANRLESGQTEWLAEFRTATMLFVGLDGVVESDEGLLDRLQSSVVALQQEVHTFGGQLNQLIVMDTGQLTALVVWGLASSTFEDDSERALRAAACLTDRLSGLDLASDMGVARGVVFAGMRGGADRLEYAVIGDPVNLSFRLMRKSRGGLLCDRAVRDAADRMHWGPGEPLTLKGKPDPVLAFRPEGMVDREVEPTDALVGRGTEMTVLTAALEEVVADGKSRILVVEGEAGIGKSHLSSSFGELATGIGVVAVRGAAEAFESTTPYRAWRAIFQGALGVRDLPPEQQQDRVREALEGIPGGVGRESLLADVCRVPFSDSNIVAAMSAQARADVTRDLLIEIFMKSTGDGVKVLILEDVHWMDSASWALVEELHRRTSNLCLLLVSRPLEEYPPAEVGRRLIENADVHLYLEPLSSEEAVDLACGKLGVESLPELLRSFLLDKADGHPFFTLELVMALRDSGVLRVEGADCVFDETALEQASRVPDTVQGVVTSRIDRLEAGQQLTLKVASVLGRTFPPEALSEVHPIEADRPLVAAHLLAMAELDLVMQAAHGQYAFKHAITRDTAYGLLPMSQRRTLHKSAAEWHEQAYPGDPAFFPLLADHWTHAGVTPKAIRFLEQAGEHSLSTAAYVETVGFFSRLLAIADEPGATTELAETPEEAEVTTLDRARWLRQLGQAEYDLGRLTDGREHLENSVSLLGRRMPRTAADLAVRLARMTAWRVLRSLLAGSKYGGKRFGADAVREMAKSLNTLGRIYHLAGESGRTIYTILRRYNLLEPVEPVPEHMSSLSGWAYLLSMLGMRRARDGAVEKLKTISVGLDEPVLFADAMYPITVMRLGQGEWTECDEEAQAALAVAEKYGERASELALIAVIANMEQMIGNYGVALEWSTRVQRSAKEGRDTLTECWGWGGIAIVHLRRGDFDLAREAAGLALDLAREAAEEVSVLSNLGTLITSYLREGDLDKALEHLDEALPMVYVQPRLPTAHHFIHGYGTMAEATVTVWERAIRTGAPDVVKRERDARTACHVLTRFAKIFPIGLPVAGVWSGKFESLRGKPRKAARNWEKSIRDGTRLSIQYETGQAHLEWGRSLDPSDPTRASKIEDAIRLFERVGARHDTETALALIHGG